VTDPHVRKSARNTKNSADLVQTLCRPCPSFGMEGPAKRRRRTERGPCAARTPTCYDALGKMGSKTFLIGKPGSDHPGMPICRAPACMKASGHVKSRGAVKEEPAAEPPLPDYGGDTFGAAFDGPLPAPHSIPPPPMPGGVPMAFAWAMPAPAAAAAAAAAPPPQQPMLGAKLHTVMLNLDLPAEGSLPAQLRAANEAMELEATGSMLEQVDRLIEATGAVVAAPPARPEVPPSPPPPQAPPPPPQAPPPLPPSAPHAAPPHTASASPSEAEEAEAEEGGEQQEEEEEEQGAAASPAVSNAAVASPAAARVSPRCERMRAARADGLIALSDALGVSSAPNLGGGDMRKLRGVLEAPCDEAQLLSALRRLSVSSLTPELSRSTGIDDAVGQLRQHMSEEVSELSARIASAWSAQLEEERQRRERASRPGPKPSGTGAQNCKACQGQKRAHTCR
jgi:hypothetical protein